MYELARAVDFLHPGGCEGWNIFHRNTKSANICLSQDYKLRLIDFGLAKFVQDENSDLNPEPGSMIMTGSTEGLHLEPRSTSVWSMSTRRR